MTPINDGIGLYPGSNQMPEDHKQLGIQASTQVVKRNAEGQPDPKGKLVFAAIGGMSNARQEFAAFQKAYQAKYGYSRKLTWFNGNRGAWDAKRIAVQASNRRKRLANVIGQHTIMWPCTNAVKSRIKRTRRARDARRTLTAL